jgi:hypothetical protein
MLVYIFIGYPKCGSSEVYENFLKKNNNINDITPFLEKKIDFFESIIHYNDKKFKKENNIFKNIIFENIKHDKVNLISNNKLLESVYYDSPNNIEEIFKRLRDFFSKYQIEIKVFYIIRKPHQIILSSYVEFYQLIINKNKKFKNFNYYINCMFKKNNSSYLNKIKNIYNYDKINKLLINLFSIQNVEYYNFDEFKKNKLEIYKKISSFLKIKFEIKKPYTNPSLNVSEKNKDGFYLLSKDSLVKTITDSKLYNIFFKRFFKKEIRKKLKIILLNFLSKKVNINEKQISTIHNYYKNQNRIYDFRNK